MKSSTQDNAKAKIHQVKGKIKEFVGKVVGNPYMEANGKIENIKGKVQEKRSQIKKGLDK